MVKIMAASWGISGKKTVLPETLAAHMKTKEWNAAMCCLRVDRERERRARFSGELLVFFFFKMEPVNNIHFSFAVGLHWIQSWLFFVIYPKETSRTNIIMNFNLQQYRCVVLRQSLVSAPGQIKGTHRARIVSRRLVVRLLSELLPWLPFWCRLDSHKGTTEAAACIDTISS